MRNSSIRKYGPKDIFTLLRCLSRKSLSVFYLSLCLWSTSLAQKGSSNHQLGEQALFKARYDSAIHFFILAKSQFEDGNPISQFNAEYKIAE